MTISDNDVQEIYHQVDPDHDLLAGEVEMLIEEANHLADEKYGPGESDQVIDGLSREAFITQELQKLFAMLDEKFEILPIDTPLF